MSIGDEVVEKLAKADAYKDVLELLDAEITKMKERGDLQSAEVVEVLRAKVKAKFLGSV